MIKWLVATWLAIIVPFAIAAISGGPEAPWGHIGFHLGYLVFAIAAIVFVVLLRRSSRDRAVRIGATALLVAQALFIVGQIAELLVVAAHFGPHAGEDALSDPAHDAMSLGFTAPGLIVSALTLIALTVIVVRRKSLAATAI